MGKIAFLYAGQGSQQTEMGQQLYDAYPEFRAVYDSAHLDFDLKEACFVNPDDMLKQTRYTQPCLAAFACGVTEILKRGGLRPDYVCGLSLGEYSALCAAGVWSIPDMLRIVAFRGAAMERASEGVESAMTAIMKLSLDEIEACCQEASQEGIVSICNINCPDQVVIGGEKGAVAAAARLARDRGARRCVPLPVSGPFHTAFMEPVADALRERFKTVTFHAPAVTVAYNVLGGPNTGNEEISELLARQVKNPVRMQKCLEYLFNEGVDTFIEIGPGKALQGFVKKTAAYLDINTDQYRILSINEPVDVSDALGLFTA